MSILEHGLELIDDKTGLRIWMSTGTVEKPSVMAVEKRPIDKEVFKIDTPAGRGYRNATIGDVSRLFTGNWLFYEAESERPVMAYLQIPDDCSSLIPQLHAIKWTVSNRNDGTATKAKTAGWLERNPVRQRDFCRLAGLASENPAAHSAVLSYAANATEHYRRLNPDLYGEHMAAAESLLEEYRVFGTPFTSGIVNRDNVLAYHFDTGNIRNMWSLMLGFKHNIGADANGDAGYLVIPEYDLALAIEDNTLSGFDGQVALHGVTPFRKLASDAYRYTIVYYAKAGVWRCLTLDDEIARARQKRTEKEIARWQRGQ